jgi:hypothetical protein
VKRFDSEDGKNSGLTAPAHDRFGLSGAGDVELCAGVEGHLVEDVTLFLPVEEVCSRDGEGSFREAFLRRGVPDLYELIGVAEGEGLQQDGVNDAEDGGVGSDAEGHDEDGEEGEA